MDVRHIIIDTHIINQEEDNKPQTEFQSKFLAQLQEDLNALFKYE
jgi:hypothetical protein